MWWDKLLIKLGFRYTPEMEDEIARVTEVLLKRQLVQEAYKAELSVDNFIKEVKAGKRKMPGMHIEDIRDKCRQMGMKV